MVYPVYLYTAIDEIRRLQKYTLLNINNKTKSAMLSFTLSAMELFAEWTKNAAKEHLLSDTAQHIKTIIKSPKNKELKRFPSTYFKDVFWYYFWITNNTKRTCIIIPIMTTTSNHIKFKNPKRFEWTNLLDGHQCYLYNEDGGKMRF